MLQGNTKSGCQPIPPSLLLPEGATPATTATDRAIAGFWAGAQPRPQVLQDPFAAATPTTKGRVEDQGGGW